MPKKSRKHTTAKRDDDEGVWIDYTTGRWRLRKRAKYGEIARCPTCGRKGAAWTGVIPSDGHDDAGKFVRYPKYVLTYIHRVQRPPLLIEWYEDGGFEAWTGRPYAFEACVVPLDFGPRDPD